MTFISHVLFHNQNEVGDTDIVAAPTRGGAAQTEQGKGVNQVGQESLLATFLFTFV